MINVLISGALGRMGKKVYEACCSSNEVLAVCGVDIKEDLSQNNFPVYESFDKVKEKVEIQNFTLTISLKSILKNISLYSEKLSDVKLKLLVSTKFNNIANIVINKLRPIKNYLTPLSNSIKPILISVIASLW